MVKADANLALLELRNMCPEIVLPLGMPMVDNHTGWLWALALVEKYHCSDGLRFNAEKVGELALAGEMGG